jgi:hypothetical protein
MPGESTIVLEQRSKDPSGVDRKTEVSFFKRCEELGS